MAKYTRENIFEMYNILPKKIKEKMSSEETTDYINKIATDHNLNEDQESSLSEYIGYTMIGILPQDKFAKTIEKDLRLDNNTAKAVYQEINKFIFSPIKNLLQEVYSPSLNKKENNKKVEKETEINDIVEEVKKKEIIESPLTSKEEINNELKNDPYKEQL